MLTIGFISNIIDKTIYLTYTHVDCDRPFTLSDVQQFRIKDIVIIKLDEEIIHGIAHHNIVDVYRFTPSTISLDIHMFYEYQKYLIDIAYDKFDTDEFYKRLNTLGFSKLLYSHLDRILASNFDFLEQYINSIVITKLVASRKVNIIEYEYDKNGDYSYRCNIECTDYQDSYLNSFLHIIGSYSPTCINNTPAKLPNETYQQTVDRIIRETANRTLTQYSKEEHLQYLLYECKQIRSLYETEKQRISELAKKYLNY